MGLLQDVCNSFLEVESVEMESTGTNTFSTFDLFDNLADDIDTDALDGLVISLYRLEPIE